jgi:hypothetical protein
MSASGNNK